MQIDPHFRHTNALSPREEVDSDEVHSQHLLFRLIGSERWWRWRWNVGRTSDL